MVKRSLIVSLLLVSSASASSCIDFWGTGCPVQQKQVKKQKQEKQKKLTKEQVLLKLYNQSLSWTPDNLSPIEKYVALHPEDEEAVKLLRKYLAVRQIRACYLERGLLGKDSSYCRKLEESWKSWLQGSSTSTSTSTVSFSSSGSDVADKQITYLFFYSFSCPRCEKTLPIVERVLGSKVKLIPASSFTANYFNEWKVTTVPTLIAVRGKKALRLTGEFDESKLKAFLKIATAKLLPN